MNRTVPTVLLLVLAAVGGALFRPEASRPAPTSAEESWNRALLALAAGDLATAEALAETAVLDGDADFPGRRDFLFGCSAYRRAEAAEILAARPEAGPPALDAAILQARSAAESWLSAARSREDWPAARRNLQRALEKLVFLETRRELMREEARREKPDRPVEEEPDRGMPLEEEVAVEIETGELSAAALERLLDLLAAKEREKLELRRRRLRDRGASGGRDW